MRLRLNWFLLYTMLTLILFAMPAFSAEAPYIPKEGFVPNEETAIKIAEAVWLPIYGKTIYKERPFKTKLIDNIWYVSGTLHSPLGGVAEVEIDKTNGKILRVTHGK